MNNKRKGKFLEKHKESNKDVNLATHDLYPKFSLEFAVEHSRSFDRLSKDEKQACIQKLIQLSKQRWGEISKLPREYGFEKIDKKHFKSLNNIPQKFASCDQIDVCRLPSQKGRLIGYRENEVFYIAWIDTKFKMYDH